MVAQVQKPAPEFTLPAVVDGEFKDVSLSDYKGKYVVLFWYPMDFTFVCPTEILAFSERVKEFEALNTAVLAASCDSEFSHLAWINTPRKQGGLGEMNIPILADKTKKVARDYGVLLEDAGVTLRGLFIISPEGTVRQITINDLPVGRSVDEVLRLVEAFQFTDEHGEVCPAGWQKVALPSSPMSSNPRNTLRRPTRYATKRVNRYEIKKLLFLFTFMSTSTNKDRNFLAVIGDEDSVTGLLLAGIGHVNQQQKRNFLVVDAKTPLATIEETFSEFTRRKDIAIILINQHIAEDIRELIDSHQAAFPTVLEIPSKDHPYDPEKDSVLKRVRRLFGE